MTNAMLLFQLFRHPVSAAAELLDQRTELSALLITFLHGMLLMVTCICLLAGEYKVTASFTFLYALLWGPSVLLCVSWLFSTLTWLIGRLRKGDVERSKISVLQNWATVPLFVLWPVPLLYAVFHPAILKDLPKWAGQGYLWPIVALFVCLSLVIYGSGLRHLYDLTLKGAISRTVISLLLNLSALTVAIYLVFWAVSFDPFLLFRQP